MDLGLATASVSIVLELANAGLAIWARVVSRYQHESGEEGLYSPSLSVLAAVVAVTSSLAAENYDSHLTVRQQEVCKRLLDTQGTAESGLSDCAKSVKEIQEVIDSIRDRLDLLPQVLPVWLKTPSPAIFLTACISYSFAIVAYYQLHKRPSAYQNVVLVAVLVLVLLSNWALGIPLQHTILSHLPSAATFALVFSSTLYKLYQGAPRRGHQDRKHDYELDVFESSGSHEKLSQGAAGPSAALD